LPHSGDSIMVQSWPHLQKDKIDKGCESEMELIIEVITAVRNMRSTWHIEPKKLITAHLKPTTDKVRDILAASQDYIKKLARIETLKMEKGLKKPKASAAAVSSNVEIYIPLKGVIDYEKEKDRLEKSLEELQSKLKEVSGRLKNKKFLQNAPKDLIERCKSNQEELKTQIKRLEFNLKSLE
ncbi:unnamed protein product, partial [marine sediment metagenome]